MARGLLFEDDAQLKFSTAHIRDLAESWAVVEHLQPDYVDLGQMYDRAIQHLVRIGAGAVPLLLELLGHSETSVARGAARALGEIRNPAVLGVQWAILFGNARVRAYALEALSVMKEAVPLTKELLDLVATVLAEDSHAMVKQAALNALSGAKHPVAVEALKRGLSEEPFTRSLVEAALEALDSPEARRALDDARREGVHPQEQVPQGGWQLAAPQARAAPTRIPRVFLSYAREDAAVMEEYRRRLALSGFDVWSDSQRLIAGDRWDERLRSALGSSDFFVGLLSSSTWDGYQLTELREAIAEQAKRGASFFVPMFLSRKERDAGSERWPAGLEESHLIVAESFSVGWTQLYSSITEAARTLGLSVPLRLRCERRDDLHDTDVWRTVFDKDFFSLKRNPHGRPLGGPGEWKLTGNDLFAYDRATGLTWTRGPMRKRYALLAALGVPQGLRATLKQKSLPSPRGLRLPTVEEAMSLMSVETNADGHHHTNLMQGEPYMLTCDTVPAPPGFGDVTTLVWVADFLATDVHAVPWETEWPVWLVTSE
jgi:hypothetical protein